MRTLFLDLGSFCSSVACVSDTTEILTIIDHRMDDAELVRHLEKTLSAVHWSYADIDRIACVLGPGGFTSLRVAVGLANALSGTLDVPCAGVHLSDLYRSRVTPYGLRETRNTKPETFLWLHSTKKTEVFARGFGSMTETIPEAKHFLLQELEKLLIPGTAWTGELIPEHEKIISDAGLMRLALKPLEKILPHFVADLTYTKETLLPWYGRGW